MTDTAPDPIEGDVYVTPRYLAGSAWIADDALQPLFELGWDRHHDDVGNLYVASQDRKVRLGFLPKETMTACGASRPTATPSPLPPGACVSTT